MANMTISITILTCTTLLLLLTLTSGDLISDACTETRFDTLCATTLRRDPRSNTTDLGTLARIVVDAIQENANTTHEYIRSVQKSNISLANALIICNGNYIILLGIDVPKAVAALGTSDPRFAEHGMLDAGLEAKECAGSFNDAMRDSPLNEMNKNVFELADVALNIIRIMLHRMKNW